ncbi:MAG: hypothetical protein IT204_19850 [Fimbriimonadaceae bacterium]|nr:hypothetical protein [Fimbriimonadaceae bacterium]
MRRLALAVALTVAGATLVTVRGAFGGGQDEEIVFVQTASLVRQRDLAFDPAERAEVAQRSSVWRDALVPARDGRWYAVYGPTQAFVAAPLYLAAGLLADGERATRVRWVSALNPLLTALTAGLLTYWLAGLGCGRRVAVAGGLGYALATMAWPYAKTFLSEPLSALLYLAAAWFAWRGHGWGAGGALAAAVLLRPHNLVLLPGYLWLTGGAREGRARRLLGLLLPLLLVVCWWLWFNLQRFGAALDFGYEQGIQQDFSLRALPAGLAGQLLSPGRGLLWYAPPVLLVAWGYRRLRARDPRLAAVLLGLVAWQGLFYSLRSTWWGNWCWGPRYFVPVLPLLALLAAPALEGAGRRRWALATLLALAGLAGAGAGLVVYNGLYQDLLFRQPSGLQRLLWDPAWSPLIGHWRVADASTVDLLWWQLARVDPALALAQGVLRLAPAAAGGWLLWQEARRG